MAGTPGEAHHDSGLKHPASARSSRSGEATGAVRGATPFRSAVFARFVQAAPHTVGVEVLGVDRRTGLLPPGLVQTAGIDAIKAQFFDEPRAPPAMDFQSGMILPTSLFETFKHPLV